MCRTKANKKHMTKTNIQKSNQYTERKLKI